MKAMKLNKPGFKRATFSSYWRFIRFRYMSPDQRKQFCSVHLPYNSEPILCSYVYNAYPYAILPQTSPNLINYNLLLYFRSDQDELSKCRLIFEHSPRIHFHDIKKSGEILVETILDSENPQTTYEETIDVALKLLKSNKFIYCILDQFYLSSSGFYLKAHQRHEFLVVGVDGKDRLFHVLQYNKEGRFVSSSVSFRMFAAAFLSPFGLGECLVYARHYLMLGILCKSDGMPEIDYVGIKEQLVSQLNSCNLNPDRVLNPVVKSALLNQENVSEFKHGNFGLSAYDKLIDYFKNCNEARDIDLRVTRTLLDSKRLMIVRSQAVVQNGQASRNEVNKRSKEIAKIAHQIHLSCYDVWTRKAKIPKNYICGAILQIKQKEEQFLQLLLKSI